MKRILYVEDHYDSAEAVKTVLDAAGFKTDIAANWEQAENMLTNNYDLFLLDIMLPNRSGWDIFQKLQQDNVSGKFIFLSALPVSEDRLAELKRAGVSDYITKPFDNKDLINRIKKALEE